MDKKYKIFISSTKDDLKIEREKIQNTLLSMDCIPKNMETFYATDLSTWDHLKNILSTCDYCIIVVAARYGSICEQTGKSFTQMEYEYAKMINIPIGRFLHENPDSLPFCFHDESEEKKIKFKNFREELQEDQIVKYWNNPDELCCLVAVAIHQFIISNITKILSNRSTNINEEIFSKLNKLSSSFNTLSNYIISNDKIKRYEKPLLNSTQTNIINIKDLSEVSNIILSGGITNMSSFFEIKITASLIKTYISNNMETAKKIINIKDCIASICKFEGYICGKIIFTIHKAYLDFIFNFVKHDSSIDLTKFNEDFINSFYDEIANIFFSGCISFLTGFWEPEFGHITISELTSNIDFYLIKEKTYIFELSSNKPRILTSYLLFDENLAHNLSSCIQLYENNMKCLNNNIF